MMAKCAQCLSLCPLERSPTVSSKGLYTLRTLCNLHHHDSMRSAPRLWSCNFHFDLGPRNSELRHRACKSTYHHDGGSFLLSLDRHSWSFWNALEQPPGKRTIIEAIMICPTPKFSMRTRGFRGESLECNSCVQIPDLRPFVSLKRWPAVMTKLEAICAQVKSRYWSVQWVSGRGWRRWNFSFGRIGYESIILECPTSHDERWYVCCRYQFGHHHSKCCSPTVESVKDMWPNWIWIRSSSRKDAPFRFKCM